MKLDFLEQLFYPRSYITTKWRSIRLLWDKIKIIPHQPELPKTTQWDPGVWWGISLGGICTGAERKQLPIRHILQLFLQFFILYKKRSVSRFLIPLISSRLTYFFFLLFSAFSGCSITYHLTNIMEIIVL